MYITRRNTENGGMNIAQVDLNIVRITLHYY